MLIRPCFILQEGVSNIAINDAFMLEAAIYFLLKKHFRKLPCYVGLLELFHDVCPHHQIKCKGACTDATVISAGHFPNRAWPIN